MLQILAFLSIAVCYGSVIDSSTGSEFVFAFLGQQDDRTQVVVINTLQDSPAINVSLTIPTLSISDTFSVTKSLPHILRWPNRNDTCYQPIIVKADGQIFVHAWTTSDSGVMDSFTALPKSSLGRKYHLLQYRPLCSTAEVVVVSLGDGDTNITLSNFGLGFHRETTHTLGPYEAYVRKASGIVDWTGATVTSDKPVAVISAVSCAIVPNDGDTSIADGCGLLVEMLPDVNSYGHHFVLTTFWPRRSGFLYRVLAVQNETKFSVTSSDTILSKSLNAGDFYEGNEEKQFEMLIIKSSKPIAVVQYTKSKNPPYGISDGISEPFMTLIPPVSHYSDDVLFTASVDADGGRTMVSITSSCDHHHDLLVDDVPIKDRHQLTAFTSEGTCVSHIDVGGGLQQHSIRHPYGRTFLALAYGTGPTTAFGYPVKYNVHFNKDPPMTTGMLTSAGLNGLIASLSVVGFTLLLMMYCCVGWIRYRQEQRRAKPWYDIYHTTVRRRAVYAIPSSIMDMEGDGELSSYGGDLSSRSHNGELSSRSHDGELSSRSHDRESSSRSHGRESPSQSHHGGLSSRNHDGVLSSQSLDGGLSSQNHDGELSSRSQDRGLFARRHDAGSSSRCQDGRLSSQSLIGELLSRAFVGASSSRSHDGGSSSRSEEFHSMVDIRIHNFNENASASHEGRNLEREDVVCSGDFEIVGASNDGRTIHGILKIVSDNITYSSERRQSEVQIMLPPISIDSACKTNLCDSQSDIISVNSQSIPAGVSLSSSSSSAESKDSLMEDVGSVASVLLFQEEFKDDSESSSTATDVDDDISEDAVEIVSGIASIAASGGSSVLSETSLTVTKTPFALQEPVTSDSLLDSKGESTMTSSSASSSGVSTSTLQNESVEDIISIKQLAIDDLSVSSSTVEISEVDSSLALTKKSDLSLSIGEDQVYKLQYYNIWKML